MNDRFGTAARSVRGKRSHVGRPKEFVPDAVLDRAMQVFWHKGYEATSVQDLVDHMGINRFSLYSTFGDKRALFLAACQRYRAGVVAKRLTALERSPAGLTAIRAFFSGLIELLAGDSAGRGCLMTNSTVEVAPHDEGAAKCVKEHLTRMDAAFYAALVKAREKGEIGARLNLHDCARYLTTAAQGLAVIGKVSRDPRTLQGIVRMTMAALQ